MVVSYKDALASGTSTLGLQQKAILESTTITSTLSAVVASLNEETGKLEARISATALAIESLHTPVTSLAPALDAALDGTQQLKAASDKLTDSLISSEKAVVGQTGSIEKLAGTMESTKASLQSLDEAVDEVDKSLKRGQEVITSWGESLSRSGDSIRSTETAASNLGESLLETAELQKKTSKDLQQSEQVILSLNRSLADLQDELKKVVGVLSLTQSSSLTLSSKFEPLASSAVQAELAVRLLRESLDATKGVLAALNTSADDLSRRLQGLGRGSGA
jgi:chromosome segregation ATPase